MRIRDTPAAVLVTVLTAGVLLAGAPAARAETWRHTDPSRDVSARESGSTATRVDPRLALGDLTHLTVRLGDALTVASSIREVGCIHHWELRVVTSRGDVFVLTRDTSPYDGCRTPAVRVHRNGAAYSCAGTTVHRTPAGILATVPRRCLGSPYRLRVGVQDQDQYGGDEQPTHVSDDALRTGRSTEGRPALSPWVVGD